MPASIERLDELIAETGEHLDLQLLRVLNMEGEGEDSGEARRLLRALEGVLVEYHRARAAAAEAARLMDGDGSN